MSYWSNLKGGQVQKEFILSVCLYFHLHLGLTPAEEAVFIYTLRPSAAESSLFKGIQVRCGIKRRKTDTEAKLKSSIPIVDAGS